MARTKLTPTQISIGAQTAKQDTSSTTASTSFVTALADAITTSVTVTVPASGIVLVIVSALIQNSGAATSGVGYSGSGANTIAASDFKTAQLTGTAVQTGSFQFLETGLTPGSTTFTINYKAYGGTATFNSRKLIVIPLS